MANIKLDNVAATASITIQLIKDYSMYTSEIISSNGTLFQSTDTDTTLTLRIYKGVEDITNKITDIIWTKFYFDNDELKEDENWGRDKNNKNKITLHKDEIEEKSIIQAAGYSMIEGHKELVTTARITMIKITDIYISDIRPSSPSDNMMWMDTNNDPPVLKIWNSALKTWISTGTDIPIVKNIIRNSNFWTDIDEYYDIVNNNRINTPVITSYQNKRWLILQSKSDGPGGGISQKIQYPITANSNYMFSFLAYKDSSYLYRGDEITIRINSIDSDGRITTIVDTSEELNTSISTITIPFKTLDTTNELVIYIQTQNGARSYFYITELSLYNASVYYPWEPCPDDVDKQVGTKLDNNRLSVFNTLVDNGNFRAIYEANNQYYIRAEYITPEVVDKNTYDQLAADYNNLKTDYNNLKTDYNNLETDYNNLETDYNEFKKTYETEKQNINDLISSLIKRIEDLENTGSESETPEEPTE